MRKGYRVVSGNAKLDMQINRWIADVEATLDDGNAKAGGFIPFGGWMERYSLDFDVPAYSYGPLTVRHQLSTRDGIRIIPDSYLVRRNRGDYTLETLDGWAAVDTVTFKVTSIQGAHLWVVLWRNQ